MVTKRSHIKVALLPYYRRIRDKDFYTMMPQKIFFAVFPAGIYLYEGNNGNTGIKHVNFSEQEKFLGVRALWQTFYLQHTKKFWSFFLDTFKTAYQIRHSTQKWTQSKYSFPKSGHFFRISKMGRRGLAPSPPSPASLCAPLRIMCGIWSQLTIKTTIRLTIKLTI